MPNGRQNKKTLKVKKNLRTSSELSGRQRTTVGNDATVMRDERYDSLPINSIDVAAMNDLEVEGEDITTEEEAIAMTKEVI